MRTVHQVDAKAQLLVRMGASLSSSSLPEAAEDSGDEAEWLDAAAAGQLPGGAAASGGGADAPARARLAARTAELQGLSGDSDVLAVPRFVDAEGA